MLEAAARLVVQLRRHAPLRPGQGLVEYGIILVLIAIVVVGSLKVLGERTKSSYDQVDCALRAGTLHTDSGNGNSNKCK